MIWKGFGLPCVVHEMGHGLIGVVMSRVVV